MATKKKAKKKSQEEITNSSNQTKGDGVKASPLVFGPALQPTLHGSSGNKLTFPMEAPRPRKDVSITKRATESI